MKSLWQKGKLNILLRSKPIRELPISVGDKVQIYVREEKQKRGTWSPSVPVINYDYKSRTITVPGAIGKTRKATIDDVRVAFVDNPLAEEVQKALDTIDIGIEEMIPQDYDVVQIRNTVREEADGVFTDVGNENETHGETQGEIPGSDTESF